MPNLKKKYHEGAFPYKAPSEELKKKFEYIFRISNPLEDKYLKIIFDKILSLLFLIFTSPLIFIIFILYKLEGLIIHENKGPVFYYYYAVSKGIKFKKYKIRVIKQSAIDKNLAKKGNWLAYKNEWDPSQRTYVGGFVKKYYLDEIPQFLSILKGEMSIVGPRPISEIHYKRDLQQGNISRKLIKGGLIGYGHINKGKSSFGDPYYEYKYIDIYLNSSPIQLLIFDIKILFKAFALIFKGQGL